MNKPWKTLKLTWTIMPLIIFLFNLWSWNKVHVFKSSRNQSESQTYSHQTKAQTSGRRDTGIIFFHSRCIREENADLHVRWFTCRPSPMSSERSVDLMDARLLSRTAGGTGSWQNSGTHWTGSCCVWAKSCTFLDPGDLLPDSPWWLLLLRNTPNTTC